MPQEDFEAKATDQESRSESEKQLANISDQLSRLVSFASEITIEMESMKARRAGWLLYFQIVIAHSIAMFLGLVLFEDFSDSVAPMIVWGFWTGGLATLTTWHGLSLRPFGERWLRSGLAICIVIGVLSIHEDYQSAELFSAFGAWILYGGGSAMLASRIARGVLKSGLKAHDGESIVPKPISLAAFFALATSIAILLALSSIATELMGLGEATMLLPICIYGAGLGGLLSVSAILFEKRSKFYQRVLVIAELLLAIYIFNIMMMFITVYLEQGDMTGVWTVQEFLTSIPLFTAFWVGLICSPILTFVALIRHSHSIVFVDVSEEKLVSDNASSFDDIQ